MKNFTTFFKRLFWLGILAGLFLLKGCATGQPGGKVNNLGINIESAWQSNKNIEYLGYCYNKRDFHLSYKFPGGFCDFETPDHKVGYGIRGGSYYVYDTLWVKWRNLQTGQVFEESVDLQKAWPNGFQDWEIYAYIENDRLQVMLRSIYPRPDRPYFKGTEGRRVEDFARANNLPEGLTGTLRQIYKIYPEREIDPHLPPDLRRKK